MGFYLPQAFMMAIIRLKAIDSDTSLGVKVLAFAGLMR